MSDTPESTEELALDEDASDANDLVCLAVDDDECVVGARAGLLLAELRDPGFFAWVCDYGEN